MEADLLANIIIICGTMAAIAFMCERLKKK